MNVEKIPNSFLLHRLFASAYQNADSLPHSGRNKSNVLPGKETDSPVPRTALILLNLTVLGRMSTILNKKKTKYCKSISAKDLRESTEILHKPVLALQSPTR